MRKRPVINDYQISFTKEPYISPFGFKGGYVTDAFLSEVILTDDLGNTAKGPGAQSVLWSDQAVFASYSPDGGNALMFLISEYYAKLLKGRDMSDPIELFDSLYPDVLEYGRKISGKPELRPTFVLNAMVAADNAVWQLHAKQKGTQDFDQIIPKGYESPFNARHEKVASVPLVTYGTTLEDVKKLADSGYIVFKIKIGADPDKDGDIEKMVAWDSNRIKELHGVLKGYFTPYTESGRIAYYLDANSRYDTPENVIRLLDAADAYGAFERIVLFEEPFPENSGIDVSSLPVVMAADESAHSDEDTENLISLGYKAIALKPVAKTVSMSFKIAAAAAKHGVPCFCADLTVPPLMVDINKCFASRFAPVRGMKIGILESNGPQNYKNWGRMLDGHPVKDGEWITAANGVFNLNERFYRTSGGIYSAQNI